MQPRKCRVCAAHAPHNLVLVVLAPVDIGPARLRSNGCVRHSRARARQRSLANVPAQRSSQHAMASPHPTHCGTHQARAARVTIHRAPRSPNVISRARPPPHRPQSSRFSSRLRAGTTVCPSDRSKSTTCPPIHPVAPNTSHGPPKSADAAMIGRRSRGCNHVFDRS